MKARLPSAFRLKFSRTVFLVLGCRIPLIIGAMHLYVHFHSLVHPNIEIYLKNGARVSSITEPLWETWGILSFMMGWGSMVIGVLNSSIFIGLSKLHFPLIVPLVTMWGYYLGVLYMGWEYEQHFQFYGGLISTILLSMALCFQPKSVCRLLQRHQNS